MLQTSPGCRVCRRQEQAVAGSAWGTSGLGVHEGRPREPLQRKSGDWRCRGSGFLSDACRKEEMKGSRGRAASPRCTHSGHVQAGSRCTEHDLTRWAAEPAHAILHPPVLPSLPAQPCASVRLPRDQYCQQPSTSGQVRDAEAKGGIPAAGPWESSSEQGQVTGASLQCQGKQGNHLTCKHQGAMPLATSRPRQHPSKKVCGR